MERYKMNIFGKSSLLVMCLFGFLLQTSIAASKYPTSEDLRAKYPEIAEGSDKKENKEILCPFWRLIERTGSLKSMNISSNSDVILSIKNLVAKATEFGCRWFECGSVANLVSAGQLTHPGTTKLLSVNISKLHKARGVAHDCGFTFVKGGTKVSNIKRLKTLNRLKRIADNNHSKGTLSNEDLMSVKLQICKEQNVEISKAGSIEVDLIFSFLGGKDRGFVEYEDVKRLFHAEMPLTKAVNRI
jgi:hypothetical protein